MKFTVSFASLIMKIIIKKKNIGFFFLERYERSLWDCFCNLMTKIENHLSVPWMDGCCAEVASVKSHEWKDYMPQMNKHISLVV